MIVVSVALLAILMAICAFVVAVLLVEHAVRLQRIGFTNHDDLLIDLSAQKARAGLSPT